MKILSAISMCITLSACGQDPQQVEQFLNNYLTKKYLKQNQLSLIVADGNSLTVAKDAGKNYIDFLNERGWKAVSVAADEKSWTTMAESASETVEPLKVESDKKQTEEIEKAKAAEAAKNAETNTTVIADETDEYVLSPSLSIAWEGLNSFNEGKTPEEAYASLTEYVKDRKEKGWKTMLITMSMYYSADHAYFLKIEPWRWQFNALILQNDAGADIVLDLQKDFRLSDPAVTTYFMPDRLHLAPAGVRALTENIEQMIRLEGFVP